MQPNVLPLLFLGLHPLLSGENEVPEFLEFHVYKSYV
jgi:hypothetical protein